MVPLGTKAPNFNLKDVVTLNQVSLNFIKGKKGTLIMFICNHCPFVVHVKNEIVKIANEYLKKGFGFVAINSNDIVKYPEDSPCNMLKYAVKYKFSFPYLFDETQKLQKLMVLHALQTFSCLIKILNWSTGDNLTTQDQLIKNL